MFLRNLKMAYLDAICKEYNKLYRDTVKSVWKYYLQSIYNYFVYVVLHLI